MSAIARFCQCAVFAVLFFVVPSLTAGEGDDEIDYNLGLAAQAAGDDDEAYSRFRDACMSSEGHVRACLRWGEMAEARENTKDVKRAYSSAVMLEPENVTARYLLAMVLLGRGDWVWAKEHLLAALESVKDPGDMALLRYYLGYAVYKSGDLEAASVQFSLAARGLLSEDAQRNFYYMGLVAKEQGKDRKAHAMFEEARKGPSAEISRAASGQILGDTAFARIDGLAGQISASFGYNTRPTADIIDETMKLDFEAGPVLQSVFRGDLLYGGGGYRHGFYGGLIAYREQSWAQLGGDKKTAEYTSEDLNLTMFMYQANYVGRFRGRLEHELRLGVEGDFQFLDHTPEELKLSEEQAAALKDELGCDCIYTHRLSGDSFDVLGVNVGPKLWWSIAPSRDSIWSLRLKFEVRENKLTPDMSVARMRFRIAQTQYFMDRKLQLKTLLGVFYDRAYKDAKVIKYDRVRPHIWLDLRWITPVPRLTTLLGGKLKYNWYLNSKGNRENSFRPSFVPNGDFTQAQNAVFEEDYYDVTRHDFEWELKIEAQVKLWKGGVAALQYYHHTRLSNLDSAPVPLTFDETEGCNQFVESCEAREYGYKQHKVFLELRQRF